MKPTRAKEKNADSKVWKIALTEPEISYFLQYTDLSGITFRQLCDNAMRSSLERGPLGGFEELVQPSPNHNRYSIRIDKELFAQITMGIKHHVYYGKRKPVNAASILLTSIWNYAERHPVDSLEHVRKLLFANTRRASIVEEKGPTPISKQSTREVRSRY